MSDRIAWVKPYKIDNLRRAEKEFGIKFPKDLLSLFLYSKPIGQGIIDWDKITKKQFQGTLEFVVHGLAFDAVYNGFWNENFGPKPSMQNPPSSGYRDKVDKFIKPFANIIRPYLLRNAPLIPIFGHRFISSGVAKGSPVLSIMQTDVIPYGHNIRDYFSKEFGYDIGEEFGPISIDKNEAEYRFCNDPFIKLISGKPS